MDDSAFHQLIKLCPRHHMLTGFLLLNIGFITLSVKPAGYGCQPRVERGCVYSLFHDVFNRQKWTALPVC
jgi:hypothetical protein